MRRSRRKGKGDECKVKRDVKGVREVENVQTQVRNQVEPRKERKSPLWIDPTTSRKDGSQLGRSGEAIRGGGRARNPRKTSTAKQNEGRRRKKNSLRRFRKREERVAFDNFPGAGGRVEKLLSW